MNAYNRQPCLTRNIHKNAKRHWQGTGERNVYAFAKYRAGMREETALSALPFMVQQQAAYSRLALIFPQQN